jgi:hypothetical protein
VAITVLAEVEIISDAMQPHGKQSHAPPAIEPAVDNGQLGRLGLHEHRRECGPEATAGSI